MAKDWDILEKDMNDFDDLNDTFESNSFATSEMGGLNGELFKNYHSKARV